MARTKSKRTYDFPIDLSKTKVVGRNGKPLLVYRGEFGAVDGNPTGFQATRASYSFGDIRIANIHSDYGAGSKYSFNGGDRAPKVFPVYLDIRNPVVNGRIRLSNTRASSRCRRRVDVETTHQAPGLNSRLNFR